MNEIIVPLFAGFSIKRTLSRDKATAVNSTMLIGLEFEQWLRIVGPQSFYLMQHVRMTLGWGLVAENFRHAGAQPPVK
jgi:hypothetical protein